jgi:hypothetical protein
LRLKELKESETRLRESELAFAASQKAKDLEIARLKDELKAD